MSHPAATLCPSDASIIIPRFLSPTRPDLTATVEGVETSTYLDPRGGRSLGTSRRTFFRWATGIGSLLSTALVGLPSLRAFLAPVARRAKRSNWIKLGEVDQIESGVPTRFDFAENVNDAWVETRTLRGVWIYTGDGEAFTVYNAHCPHLGCSYAFEKEKGIFHCPCHHGLFELKTGKVIGGPPPRPLDTLETKVQDGVLYAAYQDFRAGIPEKVAIS